jgi:hypothetical protein
MRIKRYLVVSLTLTVEPIVLPITLQSKGRFFTVLCTVHKLYSCVVVLLCYNILFVSSGYPGFITKFRGTDKVPDKPDTDTVDFENYRHVCHKWHYKENSENYKIKIKNFGRVANP